MLVMSGIKHWLVECEEKDGEISGVILVKTKPGAA